MKRLPGLRGSLFLCPLFFHHPPDFSPDFFGRGSDRKRQVVQHPGWIIRRGDGHPEHPIFRTRSQRGVVRIPEVFREGGGWADPFRCCRFLCPAVPAAEFVFFPRAANTGGVSSDFHEFLISPSPVCFHSSRCPGRAISSLKSFFFCKIIRAW